MGSFKQGFSGRESWNNGGPNPMYPKRVPFHAPQSAWTVDNWVIYYMFTGPFILIGFVGLAIWNAAIPWEKPTPFNSNTGLYGFFLLFMIPFIPLARWWSKKTMRSREILRGHGWRV